MKLQGAEWHAILLSTCAGPPDGPAYSGTILKDRGVGGFLLGGTEMHPARHSIEAGLLLGIGDQQ